MKVVGASKSVGVGTREQRVSFQKFNWDYTIIFVNSLLDLVIFQNTPQPDSLVKVFTGGWRRGGGLLPYYYPCFDLVIFQNTPQPDSLIKVFTGGWRRERELPTMGLLPYHYEAKGRKVGTGYYGGALQGRVVSVIL